MSSGEGAAPALLLGLGNLLCGDDGLGVVTVERLRERYCWPDEVALVDGGTLGLALLSTLEDAEEVWILDAVAAGEPIALTPQDETRAVYWPRISTAVHGFVDWSWSTVEIARFADAFRNAGDDEGARVLDRVEREETAHVTFALRWFEHFTGAPLDYDRWRATLPPPLTPALFRGRPLNRSARLRAGMNEEFLARLEAERPTTLSDGEGDELDWKA